MVNADGIVNSQDLATVSSQWLAKVPAGGSQVAASQDIGNQQATLLNSGQSAPQALVARNATIPSGLSASTPGSFAG